jgi:hypothetical protein
MHGERAARLEVHLDAAMLKVEEGDVLPLRHVEIGAPANGSRGAAGSD